PPLQSQNPQRSTATPAVLLNQERQIRPESVRKTWYISLFRLPQEFVTNFRIPAFVGVGKMVSKGFVLMEYVSAG
ncbi:MAG: hypothetical protein WC156_14780, partial [Pedobacter sp.]